MKENYPSISPTGIYTSSDLKEILGIGCLTVLRNLGLRAVGDRYLGSIVLDIFHQAWHQRSGGNTPPPEEVVAKMSPQPNLRLKQRLPHAAGTSLKEQLEHSRLMRAEAKARAKEERLRAKKER